MSGEAAAMAPDRAGDGINEQTIDLDSLTFEELVREKGVVKAELAKITAQLMDATRRPPYPEDDGAAWESYRDWRRRARWARAHFVREQGDIKALLAARQHDRRIEAQKRRVEAWAKAGQLVVHSPEELAALQTSALERRDALSRAMQGDGWSELLALRLYRALRHIIGDGNALPATIDQADAEALKDASFYLRSKFTSGGVKAFVDGTGSCEVPP